MHRAESHRQADRGATFSEIVVQESVQLLESRIDVRGQRGDEHIDVASGQPSAIGQHLEGVAKCRRHVRQCQLATCCIHVRPIEQANRLFLRQVKAPEWMIGPELCRALLTHELGDPAFERCQPRHRLRAQVTRRVTNLGQVGLDGAQCCGGVAAHHHIVLSAEPHVQGRATALSGDASFPSLSQ